MHSITAVVDVRTSPYSNYYPQFSQDNLKLSLFKKSIAYVFLGKELGGRPEKSGEYEHGIANYEICLLYTSPSPRDRG